MTDPLPTTPTRELEHESPQEELEREQREEGDDPETAARRALMEGLLEPRAMRYDELARQLDFDERADEWKARLWRLHNEGLVKVRWVGMTDPEPVEVRLTERGREWLARRSAGRSRMPPAPAGQPASQA